MAWGTPTQPVAQATQAAVNPTSVVSASFTPTANSVLIASVMMGRNDDTAVFSGFSGHGTWSTTITSAKYGTERCEIVIGVLRVGASPTAATVTASFSSAPARAILAIQQITTDVGVDENIVVQSASSGIGTAVSSLTGDFAAAPSASSMLVAFAVNAHGTPRAIAAATDWTSLGVTTGNGVFNGISQYRTGTTSTTYGTGPFTNGDATLGVAIAAVELQEAAAGATLSAPTSASITQTTATVGCTSDSALGTLYAVVTTSATAPSAPQVEAGQDHTGTALPAPQTASTAQVDVGANTFNVTGLTADTAYYAHFVQDTGTAEYSNVLSSTSWTTLDNIPTISSVTPSTVSASSNPVIAGSNLGSTPGTNGEVLISPTDNAADVNAVAQTIQNWGPVEIYLTGVNFPTGTTHNDTLYLFVTNDSLETNAAGYAITANITPVISTQGYINSTASGFTIQFTSTVANGIAYCVVYPTSVAFHNDDATGRQQVRDFLDSTGSQPLDSAQVNVSTTGVQSFPAFTGLSPGEYRYSIVHDATL